MWAGRWIVRSLWSEGLAGGHSGNAVAGSESPSPIADSRARMADRLPDPYPLSDTVVAYRFVLLPALPHSNQLL